MNSSPNSLQNVDWSSLPVPVDDGAGAALAGAAIPDLALEATDGTHVALARMPGRTVVYVYPMTGRPDVPLPAGWDEIPGARGCTPQSCAFRDHFVELRQAGAAAVYGLSSQTSAEQREAADRLHLPFPLLSDVSGALARALGLPVFEVEGRMLCKRLTWIADGGRIVKVFYPVFPPDRNAGDVLDWLRRNPA